MFARSRDMTSLLPFRKTLSLSLSFSALDFKLCRFLKQYVVLNIELTEKNLIKELGLYIDVSLQGFLFCSPKTFKPNKQTTWNTSHLPGNAWSSGKLDYDKLFAVLYNIKVLNAKVFAKGLQKFRSLTRHLEQNVENLDDYGCPKLQDLVKTDSLWICSSYPLRHNTSLHCAERKAKVYGEWVMQHL